jgi:DNA-binding MarR family transcriptional regulator
MHLGRLALAYRAAVMNRLRADPELRDYRLRPPSMGTLRVVDASGPVSQREVSERLGIHPSDVVGIVDQLAGCGLVSRERSEVDRRRYDLTLTQSGRAVMDRFEAVTHEVDKDFYAVLTRTEQRQLEKLLGKLVEVHQPEHRGARAG